MTNAFRPALSAKKRIVIVDDSPSMRTIVRKFLEADGRFHVVGEANDPNEARQVIKSTDPDAITLDIEMPHMDGLSFLEKIMQLRPMPVVMLSSLTQAGTIEAIRALALGAVDCVSKSNVGENCLSSLPDRLFAACSAQISSRSNRAKTPKTEAQFSWNKKVILIGSSTGGVEALERVLVHFPKNCPPTFIVQHMPENFLKNFAQRLDNVVSPRVVLAQDGKKAQQGEIYLAPGGPVHLKLAKEISSLSCQLVEKPPVNGHRPSVDVLFHSAASFASGVVAAVLTGMGRDGAEGLLQLRKNGAATLVQDKASSVVFGMPRAAAEIGGSDRLIDIDQIGHQLLQDCSIPVAQVVQ